MVCALPGWTAMMLVPNCVNWSIMNWRVPSPIEVRSTTEPTPIAMPSVERNERSLWARTAESARARRSVIQRYAFLSASIGSSCVARRAGSVPNTRPKPIATVIAAATAHSGGWAGKVG